MQPNDVGSRRAATSAVIAITAPPNTAAFFLPFQFFASFVFQGTGVTVVKQSVIDSMCLWLLYQSSFF